MVFVDERELRTWPAVAVRAMKSAGLLAAAAPARSVVCPGCERQCTMPVHVMPEMGTAPNAFVVCDKRSDINRVAIEPDVLTRWQASGEAVAAMLARLLRLRRRGGVGSPAKHWEVGVFRGPKRSRDLVLIADGELKLEIAGHSVAVAEVLTLRGTGFRIAAGKLIDFVDHPRSGVGRDQSAQETDQRIIARMNELKPHRRDFRKAVAAEEGISPSRVGQRVQRAKKRGWSET
ncbi:hypothetical protein FHP25_08690 [Vineibacter terrae]|uniref:Uncharacterized protein n=1 Tax=Vineibacter terrae TaxID=2586908 RepID=A0A5C8PR33_9HYPH|nr:hypothetical protein [Vineibacter terrae]TXL78255.1 hypothetical protein FHP25_08690 [Vineibacter terrae]